MIWGGNMQRFNALSFLVDNIEEYRHENIHQKVISVVLWNTGNPVEIWYDDCTVWRN